MGGEVEFPIEIIPGEDSISRGCYTPPGIDHESMFPFPADRTTDERAESAYWRKYAVTMEAVHTRGCQRVVDTREIRVQREQAPLKYLGAITAAVEKVRLLKTERGFSIEVKHLPENGDQAHTHLVIFNQDPAVRCKSNDRRELISLLCTQAFSEVEVHACVPDSG